MSKVIIHNSQRLRSILHGSKPQNICITYQISSDDLQFISIKLLYTIQKFAFKRVNLDGVIIPNINIMHFKIRKCSSEYFSIPNCRKLTIRQCDMNNLQFAEHDHYNQPYTIKELILIQMDITALPRFPSSVTKATINTIKGVKRSWDGRELDTSCFDFTFAKNLKSVTLGISSFPPRILFPKNLKELYLIKGDYLYYHNAHKYTQLIFSDVTSPKTLDLLPGAHPHTMTLSKLTSDLFWLLGNAFYDTFESDLECLPNEVLVEICSMLPALDALQLSWTCRTLRDCTFTYFTNDNKIYFNTIYEVFNTVNSELYEYWKLAKLMPTDQSKHLVMKRLIFINALKASP